MWNKISNSLMFYSEDFYNNDLYKNRTFIKQLYFYYKNKGLNNILLSQIINILISIFLFVLILFLFNSLDIPTLLKVSDYDKLSNFINWDTLLKFNIFFICLFVSFVIFIIIKIVNLIELIYNYKKIKEYYNQNLNIKDNELDYTTWNTIISKIASYNDENIDIYKINSIILFYENYFNALFDNNIINLYHITNLMEWNIRYCILIKFFDNSNISLVEKKKDIYLRLRIISIINFILMPFILVFILFYNIFNYGEEFYNKPTLILTRIFTKKAKWKYRYYNELEHDFDNRLSKIINNSNNYINQFKNDYVNSISKLIVFICSSFFIIFIILSLINDKILLYITIFNNKSILWFISILASLITLFKSNKVVNSEPKIYIKEISKHIYLDDKFIENSNSVEYKKIFLYDYQYKIVNIIKDIIYTILTPFRLWLLANNVENITNFINANISQNDIHNCKMSDFDINLFNYMITNETEINKTTKSFEYFNELYPQWYTYMINKINGNTNEIKINVI